MSRQHPLSWPEYRTLVLSKYYKEQSRIARSNQRKYGRSSRHVGVRFSNDGRHMARPWKVSFRIERRTHHVGYYGTESQAGAVARQFRQSHPLLSLTERSLRQRRRRARSASGFLGVGYRRARRLPWTAEYSFLGKKHHIGSYGSAEEAAHAYDTTMGELYGDRAMCNFLPNGERNPASLTKADYAKWLHAHKRKGMKYSKPPSGKPQARRAAARP